MKYVCYKIARTWDNGETTTHLFAGCEERDKFIEVSITPKDSDDWAVVEKYLNPSESQPTIHITATLTWVKDLADTYERVA